MTSCIIRTSCGHLIPGRNNHFILHGIESLRPLRIALGNRLPIPIPALLVTTDHIAVGVRVGAVGKHVDEGGNFGLAVGVARRGRSVGRDVEVAAAKEEYAGRVGGLVGCQLDLEAAVVGLCQRLGIVYLNKGILRRALSNMIRQ